MQLKLTYSTSFDLPIWALRFLERISRLHSHWYEVEFIKNDLKHLNP